MGMPRTQHFHRADGRYRLTPLYDIMSAWPVIGDGPSSFQWQKLKLAMAVGAKKRTTNGRHSALALERGGQKPTAWARTLNGHSTVHHPILACSKRCRTVAGRLPTAVSEPSSTDCSRRQSGLDSPRSTRPHVGDRPQSRHLPVPELPAARSRRRKDPSIGSAGDDRVYAN